MRLTLFFLFAAILAPTPGAGQPVTPLSSIDAASESFRDTVVTVEGFVTQYDTAATSEGRRYYLKGMEGTVLPVHTLRTLPRIGRRYAVTGPLSGNARDSLYLVEKARWSVGLASSSNGNGTRAQAGDSTRASILIYVLGGAIVLVMVGLVGVLVYIRRRDPSGSSDGSSPQAGGGYDLATAEASGRVIENDTLKMRIPSGDGLSALPGRLVVQSGLDDVSEIRFYTTDGEQAAPITFGRTDGSSFDHVQLKTRSVSNWQAKVVYDATEDRCTLVNYAVEYVRPTRVNGRVLEKRESVELRDGDRLSMGDIEFTFMKD